MRAKEAKRWLNTASPTLESGWTNQHLTRSLEKLCVWVGAVKTRAAEVPLLVRFLDVHARATAI